jgi:hypothetical protein
MNELGVSGQHTTVDVGKIMCEGVERIQWFKVVTQWSFVNMGM